MGKDFDAGRVVREQADRTFTISGREFKFRAACRPEDVAELFDWLDGLVTLTQLGSLAVIDKAMAALLEPEYVDFWAEVRAITDPARLVTQAELLDVIAHILKVQTGRPILQLAGSGTTPSSNGTTSTGASVSPAAPVSPPSPSPSS